MKKLILTLIVTLFIFYNGTAQTPWYLTGNTPGATNFLGSTNTQDLRLKTEQTQNINFYTNSGAGFLNNQRMTIIGNNNIPLWGNNSGYVGIGNIQPLSMLHLGNVNCYNGFFCADGITPRAGWRPWMITGTFMCGVPNVNSSDQMYVGLMNVGGADDRDDAVINWGDNIGAHGSTNGPDNLRFIFSEYCQDAGADPTASSLPGLEVMRLMPYVDPATTNFVSINAGIGDYNANAIPPQRRLEVLDGGLSRPQLRITYLQNANLNNAVFTDFQTTQNGDQVIRGFSTGSPIANGLPAATTTNKGRIGFNLTLGTEPGNTVEINSGTAGTAGLRFTKLNPTPTPSPSNNLALSVDPNGDVIVVPVPGICGTFSNANPTNYIGKWTNNIPNEMCDSKIFENAATRNVQVDYDNTVIDAKLKVKFTSSAGTPTGIYSRLTTGASTGIATGMLSQVIGSTGATIYYGVKSSALANAATNTVYGVYGQANGVTSTLNSPSNFGVYGYATGGGPGTNVGVFGKVDLVGGGAGDWAGFFQGDVFTSGAYYPSDQILKQNVEPLQNALSGIMSLQPKTYNFDTAQYPRRGLPSGEQFGLIAEDVQGIYPQIVRSTVMPPNYDTLGNQIDPALPIMSLNYTELIPVLIAALQEQNGKVDSLSQMVTILQSSINDCCASLQGLRMSGSHISNDGIDNQTVELKNMNEIYLGQNIPNPYSSQTTIPYFLPDNVSKAIVVFYDRAGRSISSIEIIGRGAGQLTVLTTELSDGIYTYSLVADDRLVATKQMVKQH